MGAEARRVALQRFDAMAQSRRLEQVLCDVIAHAAAPSRGDPS
jgi:hypothetical protein